MGRGHRRERSGPGRADGGTSSAAVDTDQTSLVSLQGAGGAGNAFVASMMGDGVTRDYGVDVRRTAEDASTWTFSVEMGRLDDAAPGHAPLAAFAVVVQIHPRHIDHWMRQARAAVGSQRAVPADAVPTVLDELYQAIADTAQPGR